METRNILFISGSCGLGHVTRDMAVANALRKLHPDIKISWLASYPAIQALQEAGEYLIPETEEYASVSCPAERAAKGTHLNLLEYLIKSKKEWNKNFEIYKKINSQGKFDLIIGDETYEISAGMKKELVEKTAPYVVIYDFVGLDAMTKNPKEWFGIYMWNRIWSKHFKKGIAHPADLILLVGVEEDIPDKSFGFLLPNRRAWAKSLCQFVGYIFNFNPKDYSDKAKIRSKLKYGKESLIVCSIGGTSIGKGLLELCSQAYPILKEKIPDVHMVLVCGPRLSTEALDIPQGIEVKEYVPDLFEHFAACDLAVSLGGRTSTLELTALRRPFIYFPLEGHFEQAQVSEMLTHYGAGVKMTFAQTTPELLADEMLRHLGEEVSYEPIPVDGDHKAAQLINSLLEQSLV
ncbi:glycosyltransferase [bacterium]